MSETNVERLTTAIEKAMQEIVEHDTDEAYHVLYRALYASGIALEADRAAREPAPTKYSLTDAEIRRRLSARAAVEAAREPVPEGRAVEALRTIIANARTIPDPRMDGTTDVYAVPIEDIEAAHGALYAAPEGVVPVPVTVRLGAAYEAGFVAGAGEANANPRQPDENYLSVAAEQAIEYVRCVEPGEQEGVSA